MRIVLVGNTQERASQLRALLPFEAEILLDDETRPGRNQPLEVDAAVAIRFGAADIAAISCRLLQCSGAGVDGIALERLPKDTTVCNVYEHEAPVAEYVMAGVLEHEIGLAKAAETFSAANWGDLFRTRKLHGELADRTMCVVGFGRIGRAVAVRAKAFGVRVIAVNRSGRAADGADATFRFDRIREAVRDADFVVLACPLTEETRGLIDASALASMRPTAVLVNVARGAVVEEAALWKALESGSIAGALLDTWYSYPSAADPNPPPAQFPFESLPNVRATPHIAGWTEGLAKRRYRAIADNLTRLKRGEPLLNIVWSEGKPAGVAG
jgi:phosphoglycerate dehydrogenase-like enzyme